MAVFHISLVGNIPRTLAWWRSPVIPILGLKPVHALPSQPALVTMSPATNILVVIMERKFSLYYKVKIHLCVVVRWENQHSHLSIDHRLTVKYSAVGSV